MDTEREARPLTATEASNSLVEEQISNDAGKHGAPNSPLPTPPTASRWKRLHNSGWIGECLSWILALGALAAMVGLIAAAQDQSMTAWQHHHSNLSINAVVAVLSALLKGACMYIVAEGTLPSPCTITGTKMRLTHDSHRPDQMAMV
jgi:hypothetical protein